MSNTTRGRPFRAASAVALFLIGWTRPAAADPGFEAAAGPFLAAHCYSCHGPGKQNGDLRLDNLARAFDDPGTAARWQEVLDRVTSGDMPPEDRPRPAPGDVSRVTELIAARLRDGEAARLGKRDAVALHKLSREEFANTARDLLGVRYDPRDPTGLPEDPDWQGFERVGSVLSLSATHVDKHLAVGRQLLDAAFPDQPVPVRKELWYAPGLQHGNHGRVWTAEELADGRRLHVLPGNAVKFHGANAFFHAPAPASTCAASSSAGCGRRASGRRT